MIYLKTYFHTETEINFINMNLIESYNHIDKFIICEFDVNHNGEKREFIYDKIKYQILSEYRDKIIYLKCKLSNPLDGENNENNSHINETIMRGYFTKCLEFNDDDVIISVDADEIIYSESYNIIFKYLEKHDKVQLRLNQFFYKLNYYWKDNNFIAPVAAYYKVFKNFYPSDWRYNGYVIPNIMGCHFSWCMSIDDMILKLKKYAHVKYKYLADKNILEKAIVDKTYPFDIRKPFNIEIVDRDSTIMPKSISNKLFDNFYKIFS